MTHAENEWQSGRTGRRLNGDMREPAGTTGVALPPDRIAPVPGLPADAPVRVKRRRKRRRRWYRRPLFIVPLILLLLLAGGLTAASLVVGSTLSTVQTVSTPPPQISGAAFGVAGNVEVDTGPARAALAGGSTTTGKPATSAGTSGTTTTGQAQQPASSSASNGPAPANSSAGANTTASSGTSGASNSAATSSGSGKSPGGGGFWGKVKSAASGVGDMTSGAAAAVGITTQEPPPQGMNILLMGVDARPGEAIDIGVRPDALMLLHLDPNTGSCRVLAIPRDTRTELPGYGLTKVNHALAVGGIPYEKQVVEKLLGISIQHYGLIDFSGLQDLVDAVGGVTVDNPYAFSLDGMDFPAGVIQMDGAHALTYSRYRYGPDGDFGRVKKQQQVIRAMMKKGASLNVVSELNKLLPALQEHTRTDLTLPQMIALAKDYSTRCTDTSIQMTELQGTVATYPDPLLHMDLSYVIVQPQEIKDKVAWLLGA